MTSRKRLAAAVGELLKRFHPIWVAEGFLAEYRKPSEWHGHDDRKRVADLEALVVTWLRRDLAEENRERRERGLPPLPKKKPWTGKRSRKKATRKTAPRKGGA